MTGPADPDPEPGPDAASFDPGRAPHRPSASLASAFADRVRGVIFGQAIGDALGLGTEFLSQREVGEYYPAGLSHYRQIIPDAHRSRWKRGDWTDDTDQMLCVLDSLLERRRVDGMDVAERLYLWATRGGMGIGQTVHRVLTAYDFFIDPQATARRVWEDGGRRNAANGAVMRTSVLGIWDYADAGRVRSNAEQICRLTHADPRCVASCVAVCLAVREFLSPAAASPGHDAAALTTAGPLPAALTRRIAGEVESYDPRVREAFDLACAGDLAALDLDEGLNPGEADRIGYTLKTLSAGFWALIHAANFSDGIIRLVHEGGDADTNAAVGGALLGARFGYAALPRPWVEGLLYGRQLSERVDRLLATDLRSTDAGP